MTALICGSLAYDNIMVFKGRFKDEILPDQVHILNVAFLVPEMRRDFGGCAGNIAYNLHLLGGRALPMGTVGDDFEPYRQRLTRLGMPQDYIKPVADTLTAQAYITTDLDDNQITAFHPGAMDSAHGQSLPDIDISLGMVSPDGRAGMLQHAAEFAQRNIPFIFDPGQGLPMFDGPELLAFIDKASYVAVNDYESSLIAERTGLSIQDLAQRVEAFIVTRGAQGSHIYCDGGVLEIPTVKPAAVVDPTGCGDAYRGGLLYGLLQGYDWATTGRIAALAGSIKVEHPGTQNHSYSPAEFFARFVQEFGYRP